MSKASAQPHGVMEGKGSYNKHAKLPAGGAALAMPLLERAVQSLELDPEEQHIVIADYGSSQGKNSIVPMQVAIQGLRLRFGANRAISVFHIDQPSNDFTTLIAVLDSDPDRYVLDESHVFPAVIGRSFYESVLPPGSVHLGWSSYAAVWLSRIPTLIPGHFFSALSTGRCVPNTLFRANHCPRQSQEGLVASPRASRRKSRSRDFRHDYVHLLGRSVRVHRRSPDKFRRPSCTMLRAQSECAEALSFQG
jgi:hypothetical protein